jgi:hypothetical protein
MHLHPEMSRALAAAYMNEALAEAHVRRVAREAREARQPFSGPRRAVGELARGTSCSPVPGLNPGAPRS